jgi:hypothetical protein
MKTVNLIIILLVFSNYASSQRRGNSGYSMLSPGYSFSFVSYEDDSSNYEFSSHNVSLGLLRFETAYKDFKFEGGASLQFISSKLSYQTTGQNPDEANAKISFVGMSPELKIKYFPLFEATEDNKNPEGLFVGTGAQFLLPIAKNDDLEVNSVRPILVLGVSKKQTFSILIAPSFLKPSDEKINLTSNWYFGFDFDLIRF